MYDKRMVYCSKEEASVYSQQHRYPVALIMNGLFHGAQWLILDQTMPACLTVVFGDSIVRGKPIDHVGQWSLTMQYENNR